MTAPVYPGLHQAADAASLEAQRGHLGVTRATLAFLIVTAMVSAWPTPDATTQRNVAIATAGLMFFALVLSIIHRAQAYEAQWFKCRAIAENVKGAAWVFAMQPAPTDNATRAKRDDEFLAEIERVRARFPDLSAQLAEHLTTGTSEITDWMRETQALPLADKILVLKKLRIQDQIAWYTGKAKASARSGRHWSIGLILLEGGAVGIAILQAWLLWPLSASGVAATVASAALTWIQTKRFSDLATSYTVASQDLRILLERTARPLDDKSFAQVVTDVETAVSREHSIWLGRRAG
jgi:hypothetical protein